MYLLRTEPGLSHAEVGRLVGRGTATVITLTREVAKDVHGAAWSDIECARAILGKGGLPPRCRPDVHRRARSVATWWG